MTNARRAKMRLLLLAIPNVNALYLWHVKKKTEFTSSTLLVCATAGASIALSAIVIGLLSYLGLRVRSFPILLGNYTYQFPIPELQRSAEKIPIGSILQTIAGVSATIFAIAFGLSQFVVPSIADKYSPRMLTFFERGRKYLLAYLLLFLLTFLSITLLIFANALVQSFLSVSVVLLITLLFYYSLIASSFYFAYIFEVANPLEFCMSIKSQIIGSLDKRDSVKNGSSALADSAIKALNRGGEEENVKAFLDSLKSIAIAIMNSDDKSAFEFVLDQLLRVHDTAQRKMETNITSHIFGIMEEIGVLIDKSA